MAEALANTLKHARARRVCVELARCGDDLRVIVTDDGVRFRPADPLHVRGQGLTGMKDRFAALDGSVDVDSRPGRGTTVSARISVGASLAS